MLWGGPRITYWGVDEAHGVGWGTETEAVLGAATIIEWREGSGCGDGLMRFVPLESSFTGDGRGFGCIVDKVELMFVGQSLEVFYFMEPGVF